jgi:hypothetical protein
LEDFLSRTHPRHDELERTIEHHLHLRSPQLAHVNLRVPRFTWDARVRVGIDNVIGCIGACFPRVDRRIDREARFFRPDRLRLFTSDDQEKKERGASRLYQRQRTLIDRGERSS